MIALDGVYTFDDEATRFHCVKAPTSADMQSLLDRIIRRTISQLKRDGVLIQDTEQPYFDFSEAFTSVTPRRELLKRLSSF